MKAFWFWLFALFGKKSKELPSPTVGVDDIFLLAFEEEKKRQDKINKQEKEDKKKREQAQLAKKKKGVDPKHIKAAFDYAGRQLAAAPTYEDILIDGSNIGVCYDDFPIFAEAFISLCKEKGINAFLCSSMNVKIIRDSLLEYKQRCEEGRIPKPETITTGAYR
jgi:hypothetical protein